MTLRHITLKALIKLAYKEILQDEYLIGGPAWLGSEAFDVIAKAPPGSSTDEMLLMLQSLLAERFHLMVHRDQKRLDVIGLVTEKRGVKMKASANEGDPECKVDTASISPTTHVEARRFACHNVTTGILANTLTLRIKAGPIVDLTGLTGAYDLELHWETGTSTADDPSGRMAPLFEALDKQLGLRVESRKESMPVIVIDHVDRVPTED